MSAHTDTEEGGAEETSVEDEVDLVGSVRVRPRVLILGALSAIGEATARLYAQEGARLVLVARNAERLETLAADLKARGASEAVTFVEDLADTQNAPERFAAWRESFGGLDSVLLFYGALGDQGEAERDVEAARRIIEVNFTSAAVWALIAAGELERLEKGSLVLVSSVAGDRGRASNYVYGAAKGGLALLGQGIAHRLARSSARCVVMKFGFVDTPMTDGMDKSGPLWASPAEIAKAIRRAADKGGPVQYAPWFWRFIMLAIRFVPAFVFHRTKL
ncbi:MAG: SDR family NAD(P)-dependent oxidoreductase [Maricaulaceae bacterium]|jgi:short-subunit dehydrogenase